MNGKTNTYVPYRVGDLAKFGESTRLFILSAPDYDDTEERQAREMDNIQKK